MAFNPLANFNQGLGVAQNQQAAQRQNQIAKLQSAISGQQQTGGFNPLASPELQQLTALDPRAGAQTLSVFQELDNSRQKAFFQDARKGRQLLEAGDGQGFLELTEHRLNNIERLGGDPSDVTAVMNSFNSGDIQGTVNQLKQAEQAGIDMGLLTDPLEAQRKREARKPALSDTEKSFKKLTSLEAQLAAVEKTGDEDAITAATNQINNFKALSGKFGASAQGKADIAVD